MTAQPVLVQSTEQLQEYIQVAPALQLQPQAGRASFGSQLVLAYLLPVLPTQQPTQVVAGQSVQAPVEVQMTPAVQPQPQSTQQPTQVVMAHSTQTPVQVQMVPAVHYLPQAMSIQGLQVQQQPVATSVSQPVQQASVHVQQPANSQPLAGSSIAYTARRQSEVVQHLPQAMPIQDLQVQQQPVATSVSQPVQQASVHVQQPADSQPLAGSSMAYTARRQSEVVQHLPQAMPIQDLQVQQQPVATSVSQPVQQASVHVQQPANSQPLAGSSMAYTARRQSEVVQHLPQAMPIQDLQVQQQPVATSVSQPVQQASVHVQQPADSQPLAGSSMAYTARRQSEVVQHLPQAMPIQDLQVLATSVSQPVQQASVHVQQPADSQPLAGSSMAYTARRQSEIVQHLPQAMPIQDLQVQQQPVATSVSQPVQQASVHVQQPANSQPLAGSSMDYNSQTQPGVPQVVMVSVSKKSILAPGHAGSNLRAGRIQS